jgi:hypothetical protein
VTAQHICRNKIDSPFQLEDELASMISGIPCVHHEMVENQLAKRVYRAGLRLDWLLYTNKCVSLRWVTKKIILDIRKHISKVQHMEFQ